MTRRPLRVLYLQPAAEFGGAERQATHHIRYLPAHDIEVLPVVGPGRAIVDALAEAHVGRYVFRADLPDDSTTPRGAAARFGLATRYTRSFFRLVDDITEEASCHGTDLLLASRPFSWVLAGFVGERLGLPVVWRCGTMFEHWTQRPLLRLFAHHRPPRCAVYASAAVERSIGAHIARPGFVLHNGVDGEHFSATRPIEGLRASLHLPATAPVVALVGRLAPEKGPGLALELCRRLAVEVPGVRVLIAGDSGWRGRFAAQCSAARLDGTVHLLGFRRDVERVYATADVVVSTSLSEGCPNAVLEAMSMGRAVVATAVGGTTEVVEHGRDGVLVDVLDAADLARQVSSLLRDPERRAALGAAAAHTVKRRFSVERQVGRLATILRWAAARSATSLGA